VETLCLFSGLSNKKSRGSTQATAAPTAATATAAPSKKRKRLTRSSQRAGVIRASPSENR
jgi:hypothetical protein